MWILNFLPNWIFYFLVVAGVGGLIVTYFIRLLPIPFIYIYKTPIQLGSVVAITLGTFMLGASYNNGVWQARVKELEAKYQESQIKSQEETQTVVTQLITKREVIREKGDEVVRYIDREITKYNDSCVLPKEAIKAVNDAAKGAGK